MRTLLAVSFIGLTTALAGIRTDTFDDKNYQHVGTSYQANAPDGGITIQGCGYVVSNDGGARLDSCTAPLEADLVNRILLSQCYSAGKEAWLSEGRFKPDSGFSKPKEQGAR